MISELIHSTKPKLLSHLFSTPNGQEKGIDVVCINLTTRTDRKEKMMDVLKEYQFRFYHAEPHEIGWKGCYQSHLDVIRWAKQQKLPRILVVEDDILPFRDLSSIPSAPNDADMIYLGGICLDIIGDWWKEWTQGRIVCMHAYIVPSHFYDIFITECEEQTTEKPIDVKLCDCVHARYKVYMLTDPAFVQAADFSDIDHKHKWAFYKWPKAGEWCKIP